MFDTAILDNYLDALLQGDRVRCRNIIEKILQSGTPTNLVYSDIIWPMMTEIEKLSRRGRITPAEEHLATRINRTLIDQLQNKLPKKSLRNKKIIICCTEDELQELGAQMMADLFESDGWEVKFLGGGLTNDDILEFINKYSPDVLLIYGTKPKQAPSIRKLIDTIKDVDAWPEMKIMVSGGIFKRAEGLWEEIGADIYAENAIEAVQYATNHKPQETEHRTINIRKRRIRKKAQQTTA